MGYRESAAWREGHSLDELITNENNKLETYKTHKKGLMQGLFPKVED